MRGRTRKRLDENHAPIVEALRLRGLLVHSCTALGGGFPDLVVYRPATGDMWLMEIKQEKGAITPDQERFRAEGWPVTVIRSVEEALAL